MFDSTRRCAVAFLFAALPLSALATAQAGRRGEAVPADAISPLVLESMEVVHKRGTMQPDVRMRGVWNGQDGQWFVPTSNAKAPTHSGRIAIVNEWGDPRMGIGFGGRVDVLEVWLAGHGVAPARAVRLVGYRGKDEVERTDWIALTATHRRIALAFDAVDRIEVQVVPFTGRTGFVALDDLCFSPVGKPAAARVLDFEDLFVRQVLTGTKYAGLVWAKGRGFREPVADLPDKSIVPAPKTAVGDKGGNAPDVGVLAANNGTAPSTWDDFVGVSQGDPGANLVPPDTCGANGPNHYVAIVNANLSAWTKTTKQRVVNVSLNAFWNASGVVGDPRIVFDPHSQRYIALATDFSRTRTIFLAMSSTNDPSGSWYKWSFNVGSKWPDYPTLGVDARGIYTAAYMVGGGASMTLWAIDKAPLLKSPPTVGTITAFAGLRWEGAIQPCTTYGDPGGEYCVSRRSSTRLRLRRVNPPLTSPTLTEVGNVTIPSHSSPPNAPAKGSTTPISTIDTRPMNAVFRNGSIYTIHGISVSGRSGCRWYQCSTTAALQQYGTISDLLWYYYYGSIAVDAQNNVGIGFSGSHAGVYCSTFVCGRRASDASGETSKPQLVMAGTASWNRLDRSGRNRFGDYSHIDVDPVDDLGFWTNQEYIYRTNGWRTRVTRFGYEAFSYGTGLAGKTGVPYLRVDRRPVIGANVAMLIGNSAGAPTAGVLVLGIKDANIPVLGGTLLVTPLILLTTAIAVPQTSITLPFPNDKNLVGKPLYWQSAQVDAAAVQGMALSRGLQTRPSSR